MSRKFTSTKLVGLVLFGGALALSTRAASVKVLGTHDARFNLSQTYLGAYKDHTPLEISRVPAGDHKLYVKSLITDELIVMQFTATGAAGESFDFKANFRPPPETKNDQARRRTILGGAVVLNETVGDGSTAGRVAVGAAAIANELIKDKNQDRTYSAKYGNTLEIKSQEGVEVNLDNQGKQAYTQADAKRWHNLAPGEHKVYIRSQVTQELKLFQFDFPVGSGTETVTIRPEFRPPAGETVNAQARRRTGLLGALLGNEIANDGTGKKDVRLVTLGAAALNEAIGSKAGRHRDPIQLDLLRLPANLAQTVE